MTRSNGGSAQGYKTHNPHYLRLGYLRLLEQFVTTLGDYGLLVMLDLHAGVAGRWPDDGKEHAPGNLKRAWTTLTRVFCDPVRYWNVFQGRFAKRAAWYVLGSNGGCDGEL